MTSESDEPYSVFRPDSPEVIQAIGDFALRQQEQSRRTFLQRSVAGATLGAIGTSASGLLGQIPGERPIQAKQVQVLNPRHRVPVGLIIDDSTCLVNLNRFAMPQFDAAWAGKKKNYRRDWRSWPAEIPDSFVRKFGQWCAEQGVKGKYSIVPYPACVGRLDREVPGWSRHEVQQSIQLVQELMMPNWDIHPEMVTHTRVIDLKTGHPYPELSRRFMENWDWTTGKSVDELSAYHRYALQILKNIDLACEGVTTPGGYGNRALPELAQATFESVRDVFDAEIPHYFRHLYTDRRSVVPRVEYARDITSDDPKCVVSIIGCTGDWTGGWDNVEPAGVDKFITADLKSGRMVEVIGRGEPAMMVCHWTGIHWNGMEKGFKVFQEVVRRLHARFDNLLWMKLSELARYWAAKELTGIQFEGDAIRVAAPFSCPVFTLSITRSESDKQGSPIVSTGGDSRTLRKVSTPRNLEADCWCEVDDTILVCFDLAKGSSQVSFAQ